MACCASPFPYSYDSAHRDIKRAGVQKLAFPGGMAVAASEHDIINSLTLQ
jgi:hypothetical protein